MTAKKNKKSKIAFVFHHEFPELWRDGLWRALKELEKDFRIDYINLYNQIFVHHKSYDFILGWGDFGSPADQILNGVSGTPKGLCIGGYVQPPRAGYDIYFYETEFYKLLYPDLENWNSMHAFGINTDIFNKKLSHKIWDCITVGAFAKWKRQEKLTGIPGTRLAIGQIQWDNLNESQDIINTLLYGGVMVSDMVDPEKLAEIYRASKTVYLPATIMGGGERSLLEARACGCKIKIENDNPKLDELLHGKIYDYKYYASQLKKGILKCV